jgi:GrpB-like predicted nucleotidyltransferase (UPF0157 family)
VSKADGDICVVAYDPRWPDVYEGLRAVIWPVVEDVAIGIHHVGSTSVSGIAAKPIIDIDIAVPARNMTAVIDRLASLGYAHRGDLGIAEREAFATPDGMTAHHLYACNEHSVALRNHLGLRDSLRSDTKTAKAYGALKRRLAKRFPDDIEAYGQGKSAFIIDVLQRGGGFSAAELDEIERVNRR